MHRIIVAHITILLIAASYFGVAQAADVHLPFIIDGQAVQVAPTATGTVTTTSTPIPTDVERPHVPPVTATSTATVPASTPMATLMAISSTATPTTIAPTVTPMATAPTATPIVIQQACTDPTSCAVVSSISAYWRCNIPECTDDDWGGAAISWPSWSAYESNGRAGNSSRTVYTPQGEVLYPYMGAWANGCQVTTIEGTALIVEWQRGAEVWRETYVPAGQSYTINLISPEDGAEIVSNDFHPGFKVSLSNCNPQVITE